MRRERRASRFELELLMADAFKLFTAEGERLWVPDWSPEVLGSIPQARGMVFMTGVEVERTIWTVIESDAVGGRLLYSRVTPGSRAGLVEIRLEGEGDRTFVDVTYDLTALSIDGEQALEAYSASGFAQMIESWRTLIAAFLDRDGARERLAALIV